MPFFWDSKHSMMPTKKKAEIQYHQYAYYVRERAGDVHDYRCKGHLVCFHLI